MFRMIFAAITSVFNMFRVGTDAANRIVMIGHVRSSQLLLEELEAAGDLQDLENRLRELGLSQIAELPKPQPKAKAKAKAQAQAQA